MRASAAWTTPCMQRGGKVPCMVPLTLEWRLFWSGEGEGVGRVRRSARVSCVGSGWSGCRRRPWLGCGRWSRAGLWSRARLSVGGRWGRRGWLVTAAEERQSQPFGSEL